MVNIEQEARFVTKWHDNLNLNEAWTLCQQYRSMQNHLANILNEMQKFMELVSEEHNAWKQLEENYEEECKESKSQRTKGKCLIITGVTTAVIALGIAIGAAVAIICPPVGAALVGIGITLSTTQIIAIGAGTIGAGYLIFAGLVGYGEHLRQGTTQFYRMKKEQEPIELEINSKNAMTM